MSVCMLKGVGACKRSVFLRLSAYRMSLYPAFQALAVLPNQLILSRQAMDARTTKRVAQVAHIRSKPYYAPVPQEPDPLTETVSTRAWRHAMKVWVETLKKNACESGQPQHQGGALDVKAGSQ